MLPTELYEKCLAGTATPAEKAELLRMLDEPQHENTVKHAIGGLLESGDGAQRLSPEALSGIVRNIVGIQKPKIYHLRRWWVAASAILLLGAAIAYLRTGTAPSPHTVDIQPGREGAILTLADGSQVSLDTIRNGVVALQGGVQVKVTSGVLQYEGTGSQAVYNTMKTPKGRMFQLTLPDGTRAWLNSVSSIRYPTVFTGTTRDVSITGEVYFEVAKHAQQPFRVNVRDKAEVKVLGTHFNINAYEDEDHVSATLLEGSVQVASAGQAVILKPGQQAVLKNDIKVETADIDKVMAWKNGLLNFDGLSFEAAMRLLERWYDIDVVFEKGVPKKKLAGEMTKDIPLKGVLKYLEEIGIQYRQEGRKLIILPQ